MKVKILHEEGNCWLFEIYDSKGDFYKSGWTPIVDLGIYDCSTPEEYILEWCL